MTIVAPSLLSADFSCLAEEVKNVEQAGADWIHIDVMDGHFVPNLTVGPLIVSSIRSHCKLPFDVHLMIEHPERYITDFIAAGADRISVHVEACTHLHRVLDIIKSNGAQAGVVLNPATPLSMIEHVLGEDVDLVLLMTVNPGFGGQTFISGMLSKIKQLREQVTRLELSHLDIQVDGGINALTAKLVREAGANVLVAGQAIFTHANRAEAISQIRG
jgi:ribulose-phosphate 3-epimerase